MRTLLVLGLALALSPAARADEAATAIIKDAMKAQGGEDKLKALKAGRVEGKGTVFIGGQEVPMTSVTTFKMPDKNKSVLKMEVGGTALEVLQIVNGDKVKLSAGGMAIQLPDEAKADFKSANVLQDISSLYPLLDEKRYKLKATEAKMIGDVKAKGVEIDLDKTTTTAYFDPKTNLLLAVERERAPAPIRRRASKSSPIPTTKNSTG